MLQLIALILRQFSYFICSYILTRNAQLLIPFSVFIIQYKVSLFTQCQRKEYVPDKDKLQKNTTLKRREYKHIYCKPKQNKPLSYCFVSDETNPEL